MRLGCSYFGNRILKHVKADLEHLRDNGFNYIVHTFSENDFLFYRQQMGDIVGLTKEMGFEAQIDPWGVGRVFGGEAFSQFSSNNPETQQVASDGKPAGPVCLNNSHFRDFMEEWTEAAIETGADVVFWDEPHFYVPSWIGGRPNTWGCRCSHCLTKYQDMYDEEMPHEETPQVVEFKKHCTVEFLVRYMRQVKGEGLKNSLCLFPTKHDEENIRHWEQYVQMPELDIFGSDPYWCFENGQDVEPFVEKYSRGVVELCREFAKDAHIWIQGFKIPAGREEEVRTAIKVASGEGVKDLAVWGLYACEHISWIRCGDSPKVWDIVCEEFKKLAG